MPRFCRLSGLVAALIVFPVIVSARVDSPSVLKPEAFAHHIEYFNTMENENVTNLVPNAQSWEWLQAQVPFFECSQPEVEQIYWYRWWSLRKHLR
jgi:hypothetical protein